MVKHIFGYFQSEQNFHDIADEIIKELEVKDVPSEQNSAMMAQMSVCNSVCLHIRRGDYLNDAWKIYRCVILIIITGELMKF